MSRRHWVYIVVIVLVVVGVQAWAWLNPPDPESMGGATLGPIEGERDDSPEAEDGSGESLPLDDVVPMETVESLFDLIEAAGHEPVAEETYTVEFIGDKEHVRVEGEFGDGETKSFEFSLDEDGAWLLEG